MKASSCDFRLAVAVVAAFTGPLGVATAGREAAAPYEVETARLEWTDAARARRVPAKIYFPQAGPGPFPVIIFSHGLGGTRDGYEYLGRHWASQGYVSVHLQHEGSDDAVWRKQGWPMAAMRQSATDPRNAVSRPLDVRFAIDRLIAAHLEKGPWQDRLDTNRIGVAGHSFGAYTALAVAGQVLGPNERTLRDERVKAAMAMSAPVSRFNQDRSYGRIHLPVLHMTGTQDNSPVGDTAAAERRIPFDQIGGADQYLLTLTGGDHMIFAGRSGLPGRRSRDALFRSLIEQCSTAFWDAYLKGDEPARKWLGQGGFEKVLNGQGVWEKKLAPSPP